MHTMQDATDSMQPGRGLHLGDDYAPPVIPATPSNCGNTVPKR
jgi:hypothetical protein